MVNRLEQEVKGQRVTHAGLISFYFLHFATLGALVPYAGYFFKSGKFSGTEIGILLAIFPIVKFVVTSLWTATYEKAKAKTVFVSCAIALSSVSLLPMYFFDQFFIAALSLCSFAVFGVGTIPVIESASMKFSEVTGTPYGRMRLYGSLGFIVSALFVGYCVDNFGAGSFIFAFTVLGLLNVIPIAFIRLEEWTRTKAKPGPLRFDFNTTAMTVMLVMFLSTSMFHSNFFNIRVSEAGGTQALAGYMWASGVLCEVVIFYFMDNLMRRFTAKQLMLGSIGLTVVRYSVTAFSTGLPILFVANLLHGVTYAGFHVAALSYFRRVLGADMQLKAQSLYSGLGFGLGSVLGSFLSGIFYDLSGSNGVFYTAALVCMFSIIPLMLMKSDR